MHKNILILSGNPRKGGNSDLLCDAFSEGARHAGHVVEKIYIHEQNVGFCKACYACKKNGVCIQNDDVAAILKTMVNADVIVLATPVYYYSMSGQMKTLIDRTLPRYYTDKISDKDFYFIATAAEEKSTMERTVDGLHGFTECLPGAKVKGIILGAEVYEKGEIKTKAAMLEAYKMGENVGLA